MLSRQVAERQCRMPRQQRQRHTHRCAASEALTRRLVQGAFWTRHSAQWPQLSIIDQHRKRLSLLRTLPFAWSGQERYFPYKEEVGGSSPSTPTEKRLSVDFLGLKVEGRKTLVRVWSAPRSWLRLLPLSNVVAGTRASVRVGTADGNPSWSVGSVRIR
jgi:hypothetical protein